MSLFSRLDSRQTGKTSLNQLLLDLHNMLHLILQCLAVHCAGPDCRGQCTCCRLDCSLRHITHCSGPAAVARKLQQLKVKTKKFYSFQDGRGARSLPAPEYQPVCPQQPQHRPHRRTAGHHLHQGVQQASQNIRSFVLSYHHQCK